MGDRVGRPSSGRGLDRASRLAAHSHQLTNPTHLLTINMSLEEIESGDELSNTQVEVSKGEAKARKALSKLGLVRVEGINRVVLRRPKGVLMVVSNPEVYKSATSDTYIVFGACEPEDPAAQQNAFQRAAQQMAQAEQLERQQAAAKAPKSGKAVENGGDDDDEEADLAGVDAGDVELVMSQAKCSKAKAAKALKAANGDIVQAILDAN